MYDKIRFNSKIGELVKFDKERPIVINIFKKLDMDAQFEYINGPKGSGKAVAVIAYYINKVLKEEIDPRCLRILTSFETKSYYNSVVFDMLTKMEGADKQEFFKRFSAAVMDIGIGCNVEVKRLDEWVDDMILIIPEAEYHPQFSDILKVIKKGKIKSKIIVTSSISDDFRFDKIAKPLVETGKVKYTMLHPKELGYTENEMNLLADILGPDDYSRMVLCKRKES